MNITRELLDSVAVSLTAMLRVAVERNIGGMVRALDDQVTMSAGEDLDIKLSFSATLTSRDGGVGVQLDAVKWKTSVAHKDANFWEDFVDPRQPMLPGMDKPRRCVPSVLNNSAFRNLCAVSDAANRSILAWHPSISDDGHVWRRAAGGEWQRDAVPDAKKIMAAGEEADNMFVVGEGGLVATDNTLAVIDSFQRGVYTEKEGKIYRFEEDRDEILILPCEEGWTRDLVLSSGHVLLECWYGHDE